MNVEEIVRKHMEENGYDGLLCDHKFAENGPRCLCNCRLDSHWMDCPGVIRWCKFTRGGRIDDD